MHEPEDDTHDLSDDSDYEASQQQQQQGFGGRSTIGSDSAEMGGGDSFDEGSEFEVVFWRDHVAIHPTQISSERISGRLRLAKQQSNLFLTWMPYKPSFDGMESSGHVYNSDNADRNLYTIRDVPLSDVHSIRRHTPPIGWQYVIVVLSSGLAYPPLYFYNGGVREFLATIKQHVLITRSADDANVFLVNNFQDPLQKSLSSLELPMVVPVVNVPALHNSVSPLENSQILNGLDYDGGSSTSGYSGNHKHRAHDPARDASIQVLEKFSLVTKFARDTTSQIYRECQNIGFNNSERKQRTDSFPMNGYIRLPNEIQSNPDENLIISDPLEPEKLNQLWGKPRQRPLNNEEWDAFLDSEGRIIDSEALRKRLFYGGVESNLRKEVWKFLLGYHAYDSTFAERAYLDSAKRSEYETLKSQWKSISSEQAKRFTKFRERRALIEKDVVTRNFLIIQFEPYNASIDISEARKLQCACRTRIGNVSFSETTDFAISPYPFHTVRTDRSIPYYDGDDNPHVELLHDILLTYSFYNFDLGYCQGMSDFLSPLLFIMEDESESFWCFAALMERLGPNFNRDQSGMHSQLFALSKLVEILDQPLHDYFGKKDCLNYFFCFRWLLIQFKREFEYEKVMRLWEILWTYYLSEHFHLYVCTAILKRYRKKIMGDEMDFDTLLKFINELSGHIDLDDTIRYAEALCMRAGEHGAACIPPGTPPSFPLETDAGCYSQPDEL